MQGLLKYLFEIAAVCISAFRGFMLGMMISAPRVLTKVELLPRPVRSGK
jgi:hypothetical protein